MSEEPRDHRPPPDSRPGFPPSGDGPAVLTPEVATTRPIPWPITWSAGACVAVFVAWVALPMMYVVPGLVRTAPAGFEVRLAQFQLVLLGIVNRTSRFEDPFLAGQAALGLLAGTVFLVLAGWIAWRLGASRGRAWPRPRHAGGPWYAAAQAALGLAMVALVVAAASQPVPARPVEWWFLACALSTATLWASLRRGGLAVAAAVLVSAASLGIAVDMLVPLGEAAGVPGGLPELVSLAACVAAAAAAWSVAAGMRGAGRSVVDGDERGALAPSRPAVPAVVCAAVVGAVVILASGSTLYSPAVGPFAGDPRGRDVVVLAPHMDDESAFAGETVAWLAARGARVTVVFTTDSRGGRALDKDRTYVSRRRVVAARAVRTLGVARTVTLSDVPDGNRMRSPRKIALIERHVTELGLVRPGTLLIAVSGTGHSDHRATFAAAMGLAEAARVPLVVAWGYDPGHDTVTVARMGTPLPLDGGPAALARKASAVDDYIYFYEDRYSYTLPRVLLSARGAHDVLSVVYPRGAPPASTSLLRHLSAPGAAR